MAARNDDAQRNQDAEANQPSEQSIDKAQRAARADDIPGVASAAENQRLEHSQGGVTTRDDATDLGVPMLPGDPKERQGPEDALGEGPKRGDYRDRIGPSSYHPTETVAIEDPEPGGPTVKVVAQRPRAEDIGDAPRLKGGVDTRGESGNG